MKTQRRSMTLGLPAAALLLAAGSLPRRAHAHGEAPHGGKPAAAAPPEQKPWGIAGRPEAVRRTVAVKMLDSMRFEPAQLRVALGETLRFRVANTGRAMHEFVIGTREENRAHAELMMKFPDMEHDEPWMAHVPPGRTGELVWHFNRAGQFEFACLIAGHYQAGMVGHITVGA
ncbi:cupredoxin domain-containing protein [Aquincola tertiaricarbonis]|uniref:cupredoxin domain-containing protein n=1 Tax=Aquincola tertiaricarbonis TaxID=391953 RepID=UPI000614BBC3|nr:cupredoxin family protein [Aquincola tertiaricarbonis]